MILQTVVDVILGYESYLKAKGFEFDQYDPTHNWLLTGN